MTHYLSILKGKFAARAWRPNGVGSRDDTLRGVLSKRFAETLTEQLRHPALRSPRRVCGSNETLMEGTGCSGVLDSSKVPHPLGVAPEDQLSLLVGGVGQLLLSDRLRLGPARHRVRIVRRPHEVLHADAVMGEPQNVGLVDEGKEYALAEVLARKALDPGELVTLAGGPCHRLCRATTTPSRCPARQKRP